MKLKIKLKEGAELPEFKTKGSVGCDLKAFIPKDSLTVLLPNERVKIPTGLSIQLPVGFEAQIRPRSGLSFVQGLNVILGSIDYDFRGEIGIICHNISDKEIEIENGMRIAQMVISPIIQPQFIIVDELESTDRKGGFGSTGTF